MQGVREGILVLLGVLSYVLAEEAGRGGQGMRIQLRSPTLSVEEANSAFMPDSLRCDACRIVAYKLQQSFEAAHEERPDLKRLPESEYSAVIEAVCKDKYETLGLKFVDGKNRLTGPGLETENVPGLVQGANKWPHMMQEYCLLFLGKLKKEHIYEAYLMHRAKLEYFLCYGRGRTGDCPQPAPSDEL